MLEMNSYQFEITENVVFSVWYSMDNGRAHLNAYGKFINSQPLYVAKRYWKQKIIYV